MARIGGGANGRGLQRLNPVPAAGAKLVFLARRRLFCTLLVDEFPKYTLDEDLARLAFAARNAIELR